MLNSLRFSTLFLVVMLTVVSCKKEKDSFSTVVPPEEKPVRDEVLSCVFSYPELNEPGKLLIHDHDGNLVNEKVVPGACLNFQRWEINNRFIYTYLLFDPTVDLMPGVGYVPGHVIMLDEDLNEIKRISLLPHNGRTAADEDALDNHEFILLGEDHYITMAYYKQSVNNIPADLNPHPDVQVVDCIIQEVRNGVVIFEWHSVDYPEFYRSSNTGNMFSDATKVQDYLHINSMFIDPADNNIIISARNNNQVFKIDRTTGDVMWRLGGSNSDFPLKPEQTFLRQHNATITDNGKTLILFDNGDLDLRPYSRVVEYNLDFSNNTLLGFKSTHLPENMYCTNMSSVQKTDSTYVICCAAQQRIIELDYTTLDILLDIKLDRPSYRAYKY